MRTLPQSKGYYCCISATLNRDFHGSQTGKNIRPFRPCGKTDGRPAYQAGKGSGLVGVGTAAHHGRNHNYFVLWFKVVKNAPVANSATECAWFLEYFVCLDAGLGATGRTPSNPRIWTTSLSRVGMLYQYSCIAIQRIVMMRTLCRLVAPRWNKTHNVVPFHLCVGNFCRIRLSAVYDRMRIQIDLDVMSATAHKTNGFRQCIGSTREQAKCTQDRCYSAPQLHSDYNGHFPSREHDFSTFNGSRQSSEPVRRPTGISGYAQRWPPERSGGSLLRSSYLQLDETGTASYVISGNEIKASRT